jgi:hypothetical protein
MATRPLTDAGDITQTVKEEARSALDAASHIAKEQAEWRERGGSPGGRSRRRRGSGREFAQRTEPRGSRGLCATRQPRGSPANCRRASRRVGGRRGTPRTRQPGLVHDWQRCARVRAVALSRRQSRPSGLAATNGRDTRAQPPRPDLVAVAKVRSSYRSRTVCRSGSQRPSSLAL